MKNFYPGKKLFDGGAKDSLRKWVGVQEPGLHEWIGYKLSKKEEAARSKNNVG